MEREMELAKTVMVLAAKFYPMAEPVRMPVRTALPYMTPRMGLQYFLVQTATTAEFVLEARLEVFPTGSLATQGQKAALSTRKEQKLVDAFLGEAPPLL